MSAAESVDQPVYRRPRPARADLAGVVLAVSLLTSILFPTPVGAAAGLSDEVWVDAVYDLFLQRSPTAIETEQALALSVRDGRHGVTERLATSSEWAGVVVDGLYLDALDRVPDPGGRAWWVEQLDSGVSTREISISIYGSSEAVARSTSDEAFVEDLYRRILGRAPDPAGLRFWVTEMGRGLSGSGVVASFWDSIEFRSKRVRSTYELVLGRPVDPGGLVYWAGQLLAMDEVRLAAYLAASDEFYTRVTGQEPGGLPRVAVPREVTDGHTLAVLLGLVRIEPEEIVNYQRSDWVHWSDLDQDSCNTRCEVLIDELLTGVPGLMGPGYVSTYDGLVFSPGETSGMHLDHVVALSEAARSGGQAWSPELKEAFANDLGWEGSLILVSASSNMSKGNRDPGLWMPAAAVADPVVGCVYLRDWLGGKYRWDLSMDPVEEAAITGFVAELSC